MLESKFVEFLMSVLKQQVNSPADFSSFFSVITFNCSVNFQLMHFLLWRKRLHQSPNFDTSKCSNVNCQIPYVISQIHDVILMGSFCPNHIKFQLKKIQKSYLSWHFRMMQSLKKNWLVVSNMTGRISWTFIEPLKSLKISLWLALFVQSTWDLS